MKKCLFIILIFTFVSGAYAQQIKLIGGFTISNYSPWETEEVYRAQDVNFFQSPFPNSKTRFLAGIGAEFALNEHISIEVDGIYFQRGSTFTQNSWFLGTITDDYHMNGISLPLLVKAKLLPKPFLDITNLSLIFPYIIGGGEFSLILSHSRKKIVNDMWGDYRETKEDILEHTNKFDFGLVLGIGLEVKVSKVSFFIEGRYNLGLRNIFAQYKDYPDLASLKACALQIMAGFKIWKKPH